MRLFFLFFACSKASTRFEVVSGASSSYGDAQKKCENKGMNLAAPRNDEEMIAFRKAVDDSDFTNFRIGYIKDVRNRFFTSDYDFLDDDTLERLKNNFSIDPTSVTKETSVMCFDYTKFDANNFQRFSCHSSMSTAFVCEIRDDPWVRIYNQVSGTFASITRGNCNENACKSVVSYDNFIDFSPIANLLEYEFKAVYTNTDDNIYGVSWSQKRDPLKMIANIAAERVGMGLKNVKYLVGVEKPNNAATYRVKGLSLIDQTTCQHDVAYFNFGTGGGGWHQLMSNGCTTSSTSVNGLSAQTNYQTKQAQLFVKTTPKCASECWTYDLGSGDCILDKTIEKCSTLLEAVSPAPDEPVRQGNCPMCWAEISGECKLIDKSCYEFTCDDAVIELSFNEKLMGLNRDSPRISMERLNYDADSQKYSYRGGFGEAEQTITKVQAPDGTSWLYSVGMKIIVGATESIDGMESTVKQSETSHSLIFKIGEPRLGSVEVLFTCLVPEESTVTSENFQLNHKAMPAPDRLDSAGAVSIQADISSTFSLNLYTDNTYSHAVSESNLKLGELLYFNIKWNNIGSVVKLRYYAEDCTLIDTNGRIDFIKERCLANVVDMRFRTNEDTSPLTHNNQWYDQRELRFSYKTFALGAIKKGDVHRQQTIECKVRICTFVDEECSKKFSSTRTCPSEGYTGYDFISDFLKFTESTP